MNPSRFFHRASLMGLFLMAVSLLLDRVSKQAIMETMATRFEKTIPVFSFFSLTEVWNRGVSFGLFKAEDTFGLWVLKGFAALICLILLTLMIKSKSLLEGAGYGLIIGGAVGNVWDRAIYGAVYDFLDVHAFNMHFWIFNGADVAINIGVLCLLVSSFTGNTAQKEQTR
jgi:signal peptidase II